MGVDYYFVCEDCKIRKPLYTLGDIVKVDKLADMPFSDDQKEELDLKDLKETLEELAPSTKYRGKQDLHRLVDFLELLIEHEDCKTWVFNDYMDLPEGSKPWIVGYELTGDDSKPPKTIIKDGWNIGVQKEIFEECYVHESDIADEEWFSL